jgi:hypothetical protein
MLFLSSPHVESMTDDSQEDEDIIISRGTQARDETQMETQSSERLDATDVQDQANIDNVLRLITSGVQENEQRTPQGSDMDTNCW